MPSFSPVGVCASVTEAAPVLGQEATDQTDALRSHIAPYGMRKMLQRLQSAMVVYVMLGEGAIYGFKTFGGDH